MCGRFSRARRDLDYVVPLMPDVTYPDHDTFRRSWNVAPGTNQPVIYPGGPRLEHWGYRPSWAVARKVPMMINSRLDKANTATWKALWKSGRVLVPADGWYEWLRHEVAQVIVRQSPLAEPAVPSAVPYEVWLK